MKGHDVQPALFIEFCRIGDDFLSAHDIRPAQRFMVISDSIIPESEPRCMKECGPKNLPRRKMGTKIYKPYKPYGRSGC